MSSEQQQEREMTAQAEHQHVVCKVIRWEELFGSDKASPTFSPDTKLVTPDQETGHRDRILVCQVMTKGPGNVSRGTLNECTLKSGDLVVVNNYHKGFTFNLGGDGVSTFNWEHIMCQLKVSESEELIQLIPLQAYIICRRNEKRAEPIFMGKRAGSGGKRILLPGADAMNSGEMEMDDRGRPKSQPKVACEEVVECGPGAVVDGAWQIPNCAPGDMVIYDTSVAPVQIRLQGMAFTLIHWRHVILTIRDGAPSVQQEQQEELAEDSADASPPTLQ